MCNCVNGMQHGFFKNMILGGKSTFWEFQGGGGGGGGELAKMPVPKKPLKLRQICF